MGKEYHEPFTNWRTLILEPSPTKVLEGVRNRNKHTSYKGHPRTSNKLRALRRTPSRTSTPARTPTLSEIYLQELLCCVFFSLSLTHMCVFCSLSILCWFPHFVLSFSPSLLCVIFFPLFSPSSPYSPAFLIVQDSQGDEFALEMILLG